MLYSNQTMGPNMKYVGQASGGGGADSNMNMVTGAAAGESDVRHVWSHNLHAEFCAIRAVVQKYTHVAVHVQFLGAARPSEQFHASAQACRYETLRCDVDLLQILQLGLSFLDDKGDTFPGYACWQFNFKFNQDTCMQQTFSQGLEREPRLGRHLKEGVEPLEFAALIMTSGVVLMENIKWLSYDSSYDFGSLVRLLTSSSLPPDEKDFFELLKLNFPVVYDIRSIMKSLRPYKEGLQELADQLGLQTLGARPQAGSDALLTGRVFFKVREVFFHNNIDTKNCGQLYGLNRCLF